ncbi:NETI motif-containing protein [Staphylococcus felis]|uniref:NETI motif-containing protein n=1 Tax=Staphylococcus felis TaxID=46127 RepID=A0A2K3ZII6_9STAP|nr:NETI motif-containing protein [Staphylococcus felis]AVP37526.1 NETI motif-containing protein [Staphylococcus felis]MBH9580629.1 NETI motif-containing protein [Staphylococcus felis]MDM8326627.1 NETI motif-containing protein [Staphylococcus felis]MDQ7192280.1 NETI motif-containing protein [Staphylococcus felis]PNZ37673.1 NETI motif-containing protein [Staphylococcus felis]
MKFKVEDHESIQECLERMKSQGYMPVRRYEKPIFKEDEHGHVEVLKQEIIFTGQKIKE